MFLKYGALFFLVSGWTIVLAAVALLESPAAKGGFVAAGLAIQVVGLVFVVRAHMAPRRGGR